MSANPKADGHPAVASGVLWDRVLAVRLEGAIQREQRWRRRSDRYQILQGELQRGLDLVNTQLTGQAASRAREVLTQDLTEYRDLAVQAGRNAQVWQVAATALREARQRLGSLAPGSDPSADTVQIDDFLAEMFTDLRLRLVEPEPTAHVPVAGRERGSQPDFGGVSALTGLAIPGSLALARQRRWEPGWPSPDSPDTPRRAEPKPPRATPTANLNPGRIDHREVRLVEDGPTVSALAAPPTATQGPPELVDRARAARVTAWMVAECLLAPDPGVRADLPAVLAIRVPGGEGSTGMLDQVRAAMSPVPATGAASLALPLVCAPLAVAATGWSTGDDVWSALSTAIPSPPAPATRRGLRASRRRNAAGAMEHSVALVAALRTNFAPGTVPVFMVERVHEASGAALDELISAVATLASGALPAAAFVLEIDPIRAAARLDEVHGEWQGWRRLRQVNRLGFHLPPLTGYDIDVFNTGIARAWRSPEPVWAEKARLDSDPKLWGRVRSEILAQGLLDGAHVASVTWSWRFYLRVLETAALPAEAVIHHGLAVLGLAQAAVQWAELQPRLPAAASVRPTLVVAAADGNDQWDAVLGQAGPPLLTLGDELARLRELAGADPAVAALVRQVF